MKHTTLSSLLVECAHSTNQPVCCSASCSPHHSGKLQGPRTKKAQSTPLLQHSTTRPAHADLASTQQHPAAAPVSLTLKYSCSRASATVIRLVASYVSRPFRRDRPAAQQQETRPRSSPVWWVQRQRTTVWGLSAGRSSSVCGEPPCTHCLHQTVGTGAGL